MWSGSFDSRVKHRRSSFTDVNFGSVAKARAFT